MMANENTDIDDLFGWTGFGFRPATASAAPKTQNQPSNLHNDPFGDDFFGTPADDPFGADRLNTNQQKQPQPQQPQRQTQTQPPQPTMDPFDNLQRWATDPFASDTAANIMHHGMDLNYLFGDKPQKQPPKEEEIQRKSTKKSKKKGKKKKKEKKKKTKRKKPVKVDNDYGDEDPDDESKHWDKCVVDELWRLGFGSKKEIVKASKQTIDYRDINAVSAKLKEKWNAGYVYHDSGRLDWKSTGLQTTKKWTGYTNKTEMEHSSYSNIYIGDSLSIMFGANGGKQWSNKFTPKDFGGECVSTVHEQISNANKRNELKLYQHDADPENEPILVDYGEKYKMLLYRKNPNDETDTIDCKVQ